MKLNKEEYDFAQVILKYYSPKIQMKNKQQVEPTEEMEAKSGEKMDISTKYSLDYEKFQNYMAKEDRSQPKTKEELEMESLIQSNPYLSQIACTHDRRKEREIYDKPTAEKLDNAEYFKNEGNKSFANKEYEKSSYFYQKALIHFDYTFPDTEEENLRYNTLQEQCHNNMAQCKMMQKDYDEALSHCYQVLKINKHNTKAIFRKAKIYLIRDQFDECKKELEQLNQNDVDVLELTNQLNKKQSDYELNSQKMYQKLFK